MMMAITTLIVSLMEGIVVEIMLLQSFVICVNAFNKYQNDSYCGYVVSVSLSLQF